MDINLDELKTKIKELVPRLTDLNQKHPPTTTSYLIACEAEAGLVWNKLTGDQNTNLTLSKAEQFDVSLYEKVCFVNNNCLCNCRINAKPFVL